MTSKKKITKILATGVFDVLHNEHIKFLNKAKQLGDYLIVGIESDLRVKKIKGSDRPINTQEIRKKNLEKLGIADEVFILPEKFSNPKDHEALIKKIAPNFLAVSSHTKHLNEKKAILNKFGAEVVVVHKHNPQVSTTKILKG